MVCDHVLALVAVWVRVAGRLSQTPYVHASVDRKQLGHLREFRVPTTPVSISSSMSSPTRRRRPCASSSTLHGHTPAHCTQAYREPPWRAAAKSDREGFSTPPRSGCTSDIVPRRSPVTFPRAHGQSVAPQPAAGAPVLADFVSAALSISKTKSKGCQYKGRCFYELPCSIL